jgi:hypothetical protein
VAPPARPTASAGAPWRWSAAPPGDCSSARRELVDHYWAYNHEHPSLIKGMFALFQLLQTRTEIFVPPSTAYRFFRDGDGGGSCSG